MIGQRKHTRFSFISVNKLATSVGTMTFFASVLELLNFGRIIEMVLALSARVVFGMEIILVMISPVLIELILRKFKHKSKSSE
ncbi:hypothetical protein B0A68_11035 [Flavobacterium reichenbachii]|uniref:Uncharacterized protein n=1 Tax=Flavobacterium reichenbachii TaxID=362418 RepID=A0A085ZFQ3_9FLAO|nr:hypothetical protein IW19_20425 [Flavobacterium reichenbachii]OXB15248.1 hypothetical protein B0A68_11035 [Flavobacterium reichenbachii]